MTTVTTGGLAQLEELVRALRENSDSKIRQALTKIAQDPQPNGQGVDIERCITSLMPQELKAMVGGAQKAGGAAEDTLGGATKPFGVWEAETPEIAMGMFLAQEIMVKHASEALASVFGGGGGNDRKPGQYDSGYDASRDAQN
ncbi:hypothetical protein ACF06X_34355 [Streptomyces sp. NPDC015346]|uniref:hypothetical protein n=1 Tax=Streptomyces sp. NPDC015346 TaxID=3364954 RepID=UPI003702E766